MTFFADTMPMFTVYTSNTDLCCFMALNVKCIFNQEQTQLCNLFLSQFVLYYIGFIPALASIGLNVAAFVMQARLKLQAKAQNSATVMLLHFSDQLLGIYLVVILVYSTEFGSQYPLQRNRWLASHSCYILGAVISISLSLSSWSQLLIIFRWMLCIKYPFRATEYITKGKACFYTYWIFPLGQSVVRVIWLKPQHSLCLLVKNNEAAAIGLVDAVVSTGVNVGLIGSFIVIAIMLTRSYITSVSDSHRSWTSKDSTVIVRSLLPGSVTILVLLTTIVMTNLAAADGDISDEVLQWITFLVIPLSALVNPIIHTFTVQ